MKKSLYLTNYSFETRKKSPWKQTQKIYRSNKRTKYTTDKNEKNEVCKNQKNINNLKNVKKYSNNQLSYFDHD